MNANTNQNVNPGCMAVASIIGAIIGLGIGLLIPYFLCDINPEIEGGWFRGIWHGGNMVGNFMLSFFDEGRLLKAPLHTTAYSFFWWISTIFSVLLWIIMCINIVKIFRRNISGNN